MRNTFIDELTKLASHNSNIALVVGDLGYSVVEEFASRFPDRFINAGVAEQNMTGLASGMASEGYHVFTYSIANFPTFRCAEQIRNDVDYQNLAVTVVAVGGGLSYGSLGYSHHAIQDYALMRSMPNMIIAAPGDPMEVRACLRYLISNPGPSYLRLGKVGEKCIHKEIPDLRLGMLVNIDGVEDSREQIILTTGGTLAHALAYRKNNSIQCPIRTLPIWGMRSKHLLPRQLHKFKTVITIEDHLEDGGFGSWVLESLAGTYSADRKNIILALRPNVCGLVGSQNTLNTIGGLPEI